MAVPDRRIGLVLVLQVSAPLQGPTLSPVRFNLQHGGAPSISSLQVVISLARLRILKKKFFCWTCNGVVRYPGS
jgi:hypothetical protein